MYFHRYKTASKATQKEKVAVSEGDWKVILFYESMKNARQPP